MRFSAFLFFCTTVSAQSIVFQHVNVIDATGAPLRRNVSVTVDQGRITGVGKKLPVAAGARVIDAKGKFLIPGLWDMHVHISDPDTFFPLFLAAGITGVREMYTGQPAATLIRWRSRPDAPLVAIPGFIDGPLLLSNGAAPPGAMAVGTPDQARAAVRILSQSGADFLKVYNSIPREAYFALAEQARAIGIPFVGHVPEAISPREAAEAGQLSQEHLINVLLACSSREDALRAERLETMTTPALTPLQRLRELGFPRAEGLFDTYDPQKAQALFRTFVDTNTWQTPTLALLQGFAYGDALVRDSRAQWMPAAWKATAHPRDKIYMQDLTLADFDQWVARIRALLERHKKLVRDMHKAGVQFLAGTDVSAENPVLIGFGLHEELALLVESGFTPMEALQTATRNPARYFGQQDSMGTIDTGKLANLVLLDANPLKNIHNTQKIRGVMSRGRYLDRAELDGLLKP